MNQLLKYKDLGIRVLCNFLFFGSLWLFSFSKAQAQCYAVSATGTCLTPANAVGAVNSTYAGFSSGIPQNLVLDMGASIPSGTVVSITINVLLAVGNMNVSSSADNSTYTSTTAIALTSGTSVKTYTLTAAARYLKIDNGTGTSFKVDAISMTCPAACAAPVVTTSATSATCTTGGTANADGKLTLLTFDANANVVDYTIGSTYTGTGFSSTTAQTITGTSNFVVASTLSNPTVNQPYTMRIFCDATTYIDKTVVLAPKQCQVADLSVSVSPATKTGNAGEFLTYTVTLTNAGPNTATNVKVSVPMPEPKATLLSASTTSGTYNATTNQWVIPSLPVGSTTMTFTVKVN